MRKLFLSIIIIFPLLTFTQTGPSNSEKAFTLKADSIIPNLFVLQYQSEHLSFKGGSLTFETSLKKRHSIQITFPGSYDFDPRFYLVSEPDGNFYNAKIRGIPEYKFFFNQNKVITGFYTGVYLMGV